MRVDNNIINKKRFQVPSRMIAREELMKSGHYF